MQTVPSGLLPCPRAAQSFWLCSSQRVRLRASFLPKGLLKITLPKGPAGDLFVNGAPVAQQANAAEWFVPPGEPQTVDTRAINDPAAQGRYQFEDASQVVTVNAARTRPVNRAPRKVWLVGYLVVTCRLDGKQAFEDAFCQIAMDGQDSGRAEAGQTATFELLVGPHEMRVVAGGKDAARWNAANQPVVAHITIAGNATARLNARLAPVVSTEPGSSIETAVVIDASNEWDGVAAEYAWLGEHYPGYTLKDQALVFVKGKPYDVMKIMTADGVAKTIYFDISKFFGKL